MKPNKVLGALLAISLGFAPMMGAVDVYAQGRGQARGKAKKTTAPAAPAAQPPSTTKPIGWDPTSLKWGMSRKDVIKAVDALLNADYKPLYKQVQPGVKMKALDAALAEEKATFRRSLIRFGNLPTGIDSTPLKGEYTYRNKEAMMSLTRKGQTRYFFFIDDTFWKFIDEVKLGDGTFYGKTYQDAVVKLSSVLGVPGRLLSPDPKENRYATEVDWKDPATHLRAIERGDAGFAIGYEDNMTLAKLDQLRSYKPPIENDIDPAVADAIRGSDPAPGKKP